MPAASTAVTTCHAIHYRSALELSNRLNMKINRIDELAQLCREHGVVPRASSFGDCPRNVQRISGILRRSRRAHEGASVYPLYVLPNTVYAERADELGIVTASPEPDTDYAYCIGHAKMSFAII